MKSNNLFAELKRRSVYKVAIAYAVVGWLIIQVTATIVPALHLPDGLTTAVVVLILIGFPIALLISWAFEATPEGLKRTEDVSPNENLPRWSKRKFVALIVIVALIPAGLLTYQLFRAKGRSAEPAIAVAPTSEKSIAVLPFENLSSDKENAYFADGIQDEILTRLSKIAALKVISRTSTQKYKSAPDNLREIGKQLGVAHLVEGSVQKIGNAVHVNVQLIRAVTDEHLWAESYNRKLDDVFAVEGEVATAIANQLKAKLSGDEQKAVAEKPTQDLAAYDAYLRGLSLERQLAGADYAGVQEAAGQYATAVQFDPKFALAWARLATIRSVLCFNRIDRQTNSPEAVKQAADTAMSLQPDLAETWIAQGSYLYRVRSDYSGGLHAYEEGRKRAPNNAFVYLSMAYVERRLGRWGEAGAHFKKAIELDPQNFSLFIDYGREFLNLLQRFDEAHAALDRALEISPKEESVVAMQADLFRAEGRLPEAAAMLARIPADSTDNFVVQTRASLAVDERRFDDAIAAIEYKLATLTPAEAQGRWARANVTFLGFIYEWAGKREKAQVVFERALQAFQPTPTTVGAPEMPQIYAGLGDKEKALAEAKQLVAHYNGDAIAQPQAEALLAFIQARFGDRDAAIPTLAHLLEVPAGVTIANLKLDPSWDPLRNDPRFQKLIAESSPNPK